MREELGEGGWGMQRLPDVRFRRALHKELLSAAR